MSKIYKNNNFIKWQKKSRLSDSDLVKAVAEMEDGLIDATLGGCLFKKRIAKKGRGKSGGFRTIVAAKQSIGWVFLFGFEKNESDNISTKELIALKEYASDYLFVHLTRLLKLNEIFEVLHNE